MAAGAARLPAARRRAARRRQRPRPGGDRSHQRLASERRRRARRRARRRHQRVRVRAAGLLGQRALAPARRQRLAHGRAAAAAGLAERHRAPAARARRRHARARLDRRRRGAVDRPRALARAHAVTAVLLALFGGIALLLYGIRLSGDSLQRAAGGRLRHLLTGMARRRLIAVASGAAVTAIIQSSAATTLMLIGFVSAGLMTFRQTLGIILGADIGTTFTVQLIAFRVTDYAPALVGLGSTIGFFARRRVMKDAGQALLGLALTAFKVLGVGRALPFIGPFTALVAHTAADPARQIANAHTFFNVGMSLLFLPFTPWAARAIEAAVPADELGDNPFKTRYLDE